MTKIEPIYVTFKQATWLKEKGFDIPLEEIYYSVYDIEDKNLMKNVHQNTLVKGKNLFYHAPEQWQVLEWLRIKHSLWILALPTLCGYYAFKIIDVQLDPENPIERPPYKEVDAFDYNTPYEAYSAAFDSLIDDNLI